MSLILLLQCKAVPVGVPWIAGRCATGIWRESPLAIGGCDPPSTQCAFSKNWRCALTILHLLSAQVRLTISALAFPPHTSRVRGRCRTRCHKAQASETSHTLGTVAKGARRLGARIGGAWPSFRTRPGGIGDGVCQGNGSPREILTCPESELSGG